MLRARLGRVDRSVFAIIPIDVAGLLGLLLTTRLAAEQLGAEGFGEFQVARRTSTVFAAIATFGLAVALPRALAARQASEVPALIAASLALLAVITAPLVLGLLVLEGTMAPLGLGVWVAAAIAALGFGSALLALAQSTERGLLNIRKGNLLALVPTFVPLAVVLVWASDAAQLTASMGIAIAAISGLSLATHLRPAPSTGTTLRRLRSLGKIGATRVVGDVAMFALLAMPAWHLASNGQIAQAGVVAVPLLLLQGAASSFTAGGAYLLPYVRRALGRRDFAGIRPIVDLVALGTLAFGALGLLVGWALFNQLARFIVGTELAELAGQSRWLVLAMPGWLVFTVLRHVLEALADWPINATFVVAAVVGLQLTFVNYPPTLQATSVATAVALNLLGLGTFGAWLVLSRSGRASTRTGGSAGAPVSEDDTSPGRAD